MSLFTSCFWQQWQISTKEKAPGKGSDDDWDGWLILIVKSTWERGGLGVRNDRSFTLIFFSKSLWEQVFPYTQIKSTSLPLKWCNIQKMLYPRSLLFHQGDKSIDDYSTRQFNILNACVLSLLFHSLKLLFQFRGGTLGVWLCHESSADTGDLWPKKKAFRCGGSHM